MLEGPPKPYALAVFIDIQVLMMIYFESRRHAAFICIDKEKNDEFTYS